MSATLKSAKKSTNVRFAWSRVMAVGALRVMGDWAPSVSGALAGWLWQSPSRHDRPSREAEVLERGRPKRVPLGVHGLRAWTWGEGPTVLLVHGWEGRGSQLSAFVDPLVAAGFRVVAFDAPAHGDSGGDRASLFSFTDAVHATARRFGPLYGVIAHSMGAAATGYAVLGGLAPERLVFVAPADASLALGRFAQQVGIGARTQDRMTREMVRRYGLPVAAFSAEEFGRRIDGELLVIHDRDDTWVPLSDGETWARGAGAQLVETRGLGHHRVLRAPEVVERAVAFLADGEVPVSVPRPWVDEPAAVVLHKPWYAWEIELPQVTEEEVYDELSYGRD